MNEDSEGTYFSTELISSFTKSDQLTKSAYHAKLVSLKQ